MIRERVVKSAPGMAVAGVLIPGILLLMFLLVRSVQSGAAGLSWLTGLGITVGCVLLGGLFMVNPNEGRVLQLFGAYVGSVREPGLRWANPFYTKKHVSLRAHNFETGSRLKVNDLDGNPIECSAVVVWRVVDTAQAVFEVNDYQMYVKVSAEAAIRKLAMSYPYDTHDEAQVSLRGNPVETATHLKHEMQERLGAAGVEVMEARIANLAYAPEIAQAMLRRQQAAAIIAARQKIVEGSVGMVEMALERLSRQNIIQLDEERKAAMVSNLLVVLCSESATQPVVNAGTLYT